MPFLLYSRVGFSLFCVSIVVTFKSYCYIYIKKYNNNINISELFLIPGLEDLVNRLNHYGPETWKTLASRLNLSPDDIRVMELYYRNDLPRQAVHALELWSNRNGVDNNYKAKTLSKALRDNNNPDVADYLDQTYGVKGQYFKCSL